MKDYILELCPKGELLQLIKQVYLQLHKEGSVEINNTLVKERKGKLLLMRPILLNGTNGKTIINNKPLLVDLRKPFFFIGVFSNTDSLRQEHLTRL
jgi:hypothetical protein